MGEGTSCLRGKKQQEWVRKFLPNCRLSQKVCLSVKFCKYKCEFIVIPLPPQKKHSEKPLKNNSEPNIAYFLLGFCILHVHSGLKKERKKNPREHWHQNTYTVFFQFYTYYKPDTNSMLLNNELLNGKGKNDEILKRILWTYFLVSGVDWKYDTFSCFLFLDAKFNQE